MKKALLIIIFSCSFGALAKSSVLKSTEEKYRSLKSFQFDTEKITNIKILNKKKKSTGVIQVKTGGKLRWENFEPDHSLVVINPKVVWLVEFPAEAEEKVSALKALNPHKSQPQALVTFLMGKGRISDEFSVVKETTDKKSKKTDVTLKPKDPAAQVKNLKLIIDPEAKIIEFIEFEDEIGNVTELHFTNLIANKELKDDLFEFVPTENTDVTVLK